MKFLLDENADARLARYLESLGHEVTSVRKDYPQSIPDKTLLELAVTEQRVIITNDRDFADLVLKQKLPHGGVIWLRLSSKKFVYIKGRVHYVITSYARNLTGFIEVTDQDALVQYTDELEPVDTL